MHCVAQCDTRTLACARLKKLLGTEFFTRSSVYLHSSAIRLDLNFRCISRGLLEEGQVMALKLSQILPPKLSCTVVMKLKPPSCIRSGMDSLQALPDM